MDCLVFSVAMFLLDWRRNSGSTSACLSSGTFYPRPPPGRGIHAPGEKASDPRSTTANIASGTFRAFVLGVLSDLRLIYIRAAVSSPRLGTRSRYRKTQGCSSPCSDGGKHRPSRGGVRSASTPQNAGHRRDRTDKPVFFSGACVAYMRTSYDREYVVGLSYMRLTWLCVVEGILYTLTLSFVCPQRLTAATYLPPKRKNQGNTKRVEKQNGCVRN